MVFDVKIHYAMLCHFFLYCPIMFKLCTCSVFLACGTANEFWMGPSGPTVRQHLNSTTHMPHHRDWGITY